MVKKVKAAIIPYFLVGFFWYFFMSIIVFATDKYFPPVFDYGGLLTSVEEKNLRDEIERLQGETGFAFGVVTYNEVTTYSSLLSHIKTSVGPSYFGENRFIMAINLTTREMVMELNGTAQEKVSDSQMNVILDQVAPYFTAGNYGIGFMKYLELTEGYITGKSNAIAIEDKIMENSSFILVSFFVALFTAGCITYYFVYEMNNVREENNAKNYMDRSEFLVTHDREVYLFRNVVTTPRQQSSGHTGGGRSSGGGSRKF